MPDVDPIASCPPPGDWSLPSNHAGIAAAALVTVALAWRRLAVMVLPVTVLAAGSRVFVGVHYPHDVLAGLALGAVVAPLVVLVLARPVTALVDLLRISPLRPLLASGRRASGGAHALGAPTAQAPLPRCDAGRR